MEDVVGSYGVCNWFPEHGMELVAEQDREAFVALRPAGKVFRCVGQEGEWLLLQYTHSTYRARPEVLKKIPPPAFELGQQVAVGERAGSVMEIGWHFKTASPIYFLAFEGKPSSRRYMESELRSA